MISCKIKSFKNLWVPSPSTLLKGRTTELLFHLVIINFSVKKFQTGIL